MKPKVFSKKLSLKKETISSLNPVDKSKVVGGRTLYTCAISYCYEMCATDEVSLCDSLCC
jgi:hypothetical protein